MFLCLNMCLCWYKKMSHNTDGVIVLWNRFYKGTYSQQHRSVPYLLFFMLNYNYICNYHDTIMFIQLFIFEFMYICWKQLFFLYWYWSFTSLWVKLSFTIGKTLIFVYNASLIKIIILCCVFFRSYKRKSSILKYCR